MENWTIPIAGQLFADKDKKPVQFIVAACYREKEGHMAVYQDLSGEYKVYAMPLEAFMKEMVPFLPQPEEAADVKSAHRQEKEYGEERSTNFNIKEDAKTMTSEWKTWQEEGSETVNPVLMAFLDAENYEEKLNVLTGSRKYLNESILNHMAMSVDCTIGEGDIEERIGNLAYCLKTHARFESRRLR